MDPGSGCISLILRAAVMSDNLTVAQTRINGLLHPADLAYFQNESHDHNQPAADLDARTATFDSNVGRPLAAGNYSRISRGVGFFVALYHAMNEDELSVIDNNKELLEDEIFDLTNRMVKTTTTIELHKLKLRRPGLDESACQNYQDVVAAAHTTFAYELELLTRLCQDTGLLAAIEEEET